MPRNTQKNSPRYVSTEMNQARALRAMAALQSYSKASGQNLLLDSDDAIGDLLCDLRHLCAAKNLDYDQLMMRGREHFALEAVGKEF